MTLKSIWRIGPYGISEKSESNLFAIIAARDYETAYKELESKFTSYELNMGECQTRDTSFRTNKEGIIFAEGSLFQKTTEQIDVNKNNICYVTFIYDKSPHCALISSSNRIEKVEKLLVKSLSSLLSRGLGDVIKNLRNYNPNGLEPQLLNWEIDKSGVIYVKLPSDYPTRRTLDVLTHDSYLPIPVSKFFEF